MLSDILIALLVSAAFAIGALLYKWTEEEIDYVKQKFRSEFLTKAKNVALAPIGILGVVQAAATTSKYFGTISILMLAFAIWFGSFVVAEKDSKLTRTYILETAITFLVFFGFVYFVISMLSRT
ncbi:MAG: hypothetical protein NTY99_02310 [DPANN group archaeon]|nr:hypothetical protein [DPANN group archaeon]